MKERLDYRLIFNWEEAWDKAKQIIDKLPDYKVAKILLFLQGFELSDEIEDDFICERIYQEYLNDPNKDKEETYTLANCKKEWGL